MPLATELSTAHAGRSLLGALCLAPIVIALCYVLAPHATTTNLIRVAVPGGSVPLSFDAVRLSRQDRAYVIDAWGRQDRARLLVRNDIHSADAYQALAGLQPACRGRLELLVLPQQRAPVLSLVLGPGWQLTAEQPSNYWTLVRGRLWALLLGMALAAGSLALGRRAQQAT